MNLATAVQSSIGRKIINALTGLFFVGFVIGHLTGNFLLFAGPDAFNNYAYFLTHIFHGVGLYVVEAVMIAFLLMHAMSGLSIWMNKWRARDKNYQVSRNAGGKSRKSLASSTMLWSGIILLLFIIFHVAQFKFGIIDGRHPTEGTEVLVDGVLVENLYGRVVYSFAQPVWWIFYSLVMVVLGAHLWHGGWSAFQSLGLANDRYLPTIRKAAYTLAALLTAGFLLIPSVIYLDSLRGDKSHFKTEDIKYAQKYAIPHADTITPASH